MSAIPTRPGTRPVAAPSLFDQLAGQVRPRDGWSWLGLAFDKCVDAAVVLLIIITTAAVVALPSKMADGEVSWAGLVWLVAMVIGVGLAALRPLRTLQGGLLILPFVLLTGWVWLSVAWTESLFDTIRGALFLTGSQLAAVAIAARYSWEKLIKLTGLSLLILCGLSLLLAVGVPSIGRMSEIHPGAWSGVWAEKQALGFFSYHLAAIGIALALYDRRNWHWLLVVPLAVVLMLGATGRTAILMSVLGVGVLAWAWMLQQGPRVALAMGWAGLVGGLCAFGLAFALTDELLKLMGRSGDLTGRTEIWDVLRNIARIDPIKGLGYQSFWRGEFVMTSPYQWIIDQTGFTPANAHNSWLDTQVQLGLVGLVLLIASVGWCWMLALGRLRNGGLGAAFALSTLSALTLISFSETIFLNPIDFQWFLFVMIAAKLALGDEAPQLEPLADPDRLEGRMEGAAWTFRPPDA